jgi:hypothetical protein
MQRRHFLKNRQIFGAINKMEFELQGFKFSLTVDEIKQIVGLIKENIDRDKKNLCLLLYLTNEVILDWYNTIIKGVPPQLLIRIVSIACLPTLLIIPEKFRKFISIFKIPIRNHN